MRVIALLAATLGLLTTAEPVLAFCRTTTCDPRLEDCQVDSRGCATVGFPLRWPSQCVGWGVQIHGSRRLGISADDLRREVDAAFARWEGVRCEDGEPPSIVFEPYLEAVECDDAVYNKTARNANVWMFRDEVWPHDGIEGAAIALTTTTYSLRNGDIYDADVELNSRDRVFSIDPDGPSDPTHIDLASTLTHEAGHFLGLAHNPRSVEVTMTPGYIGLAALSLEADDVAGVCEIYPASDPVALCDFTPRHGFATACAAPIGSEPGGCALAAAGDPRHERLLVPALALLAFAFARRRRAAAPLRT